MIPKSELEARQKTLRKNLVKQQLDALVVPLGIYFNYYFGKQGEPSERLIAGIIPRDDDPFIIAPAFEVSNIEKSTYIDDIVGWEETQSPYAITSKELVEREIGSKIGVDPKIWYSEVEKLEQFTDGTFVTTSILEKQRAIKTNWEIEQLREATKASAKGILDAIPKLKKGMSEQEFKDILSSQLKLKSGNVASFTLVQFGSNSAIPHGMPSDKKLQNDEVVLIDAGTSINGYQGDITITVPFGNPDDFYEIYEIVYEANRLALNSDKENMIPSELDKIARKHISDAGFGDNFTHRLGHGIGLEVHEHPYIVKSNVTPLEDGNCHTIEPGIYIPGKFGIRIEDDVLVTKKGASLLYDTPRHNFELI